MVSDVKTFTNKGCKIAARQKVSFWENFALLSRIFFGIEGGGAGMEKDMNVQAMFVAFENCVLW